MQTKKSTCFNRRQLFTHAAPLGIAGAMLGALTPSAHAEGQQVEYKDAHSVGSARLTPYANGGVQFTSLISANSSQRFFTYDWPYDHPVLWTVLPVDAPLPDAELISLTNVSTTSNVDYYGNRTIVYWLTISNSGNSDHTIRGIYLRFDEINA
jgi:hypothetical protein